MRAWLTLVPLVACTGAAPTAPTPVPPSADGSVTVVMSSRVEAELEPCG